MNEYKKYSIPRKKAPSTAFKRAGENSWGAGSDRAQAAFIDPASYRRLTEELINGCSFKKAIASIDKELEENPEPENRFDRWSANKGIEL